MLRSENFWLVRFFFGGARVESGLNRKKLRYCMRHDTQSASENFGVHEYVYAVRGKVPDPPILAANMRAMRNRRAR